MEITEPFDLEACVERGREIASQISRLDAQLVAVVEELQEHDDEHWGMTTRQFIAWRFGLTPAEAGRTCRLAQRLRPLPQLTAELSEGRLSADTVATLAAVATPENEAAMIETATVATGSQLQTLIRAYKQNATPINDDAPEEPVLDTLSFTVREGRWKLRGDLAPALGAQVEAALRAEKEAEIADRARDDDGFLSRDPEVSNAAALVRMAQSVVAGKVRRDGVVPERFMALVHIDDEGGHVQGGGPIDQPSITELLCESWISFVVKRHGQPATITSPTRLATPNQQRALLARDRTCRFPGCGRSLYLKAHHIRYSTDGGPTQIDNLVLLCQKHHSVVHKPGWRVERTGDGKFWFHAPNGKIVLPGRSPVARAGPAPPSTRYDLPYDRLTSWGASVIMGNWTNRPRPTE